MLSNNTIVIDLDGTLLTKNKIIENEDIETLKTLSKTNSIVIASGRHYLEIENIINTYKLDKIIQNLIICRNGQIIYDINEKKVIKNKTIDYNELVKIIKVLDDKTIYWYLIQGNQLFCKKIDYNCLKYIDNNRYIINVISDISELKKYSIEKFIINSNSLKEIKNIEKILVSKYNVDFFKFTRKKMYKEKIYWQNNILPKDTNKFTAVQYVVSKLNLSNNLISFGDGINDYELLLNSNIGICMEQSCKELKKISNYVTKSNDDNGFSFAIKNFNF